MHPAAAAKFLPAALASPFVGGDDLQSWGSSDVGYPRSVLYSPLTLIACSNNPAAVGEAIKSHWLDPPADSPKVVTLLGSPPNAATLSWTH